MITRTVTTTRGDVTLSDVFVIKHIRLARDKETTARKLSTAIGVSPVICREFLDHLTDAGILTRSKPAQVYIYEIADRITAPISEPAEA